MHIKKCLNPKTSALIDSALQILSSFFLIKITVVVNYPISNCTTHNILTYIASSKNSKQAREPVTSHWKESLTTTTTCELPEGGNQKQDQGTQTIL